MPRLPAQQLPLVANHSRLISRINFTELHNGHTVTGFRGPEITEEGQATSAVAPGCLITTLLVGDRAELEEIVK